MNWRATGAIARKDIVDAVKNRYILISLVLPLALSVFLQLVFSTPREGAMRIAVYDPTGSRLVTGLESLPQVEVREVDSGEAVITEVEKDAVGGIVLPLNFDAAMDAGERPELTVYVDRFGGGGGIAAFERLVERQVWAMAGQAMPARIVWADAGVPTGLRAEGGIRLDLYLMTMFLVLALAITGALVVPLLLVEEKEKHTLDFLLVSPASTTDVVTGKVVTGLLYSLLMAGILITLNQGWMGDWPLVLLAVVLGALFTAASGLLMGSICRTTMQVNTWSSISMLILMAPSWLAVLTIPPALDVALHLIPTRSLVDVIEVALAGEASLAQVWGDLSILVGGVFVAFVAVVWVLRRQEG